MKDTIIQLYSDHGDHLHSLLEYSPSGMMKKTHPPLIMIMHEGVADQYHKNLVSNEQKLIYHYEIFETLRQYTKIEKPTDPEMNKFVKAYSVMEEIIPSGRSCKDFPMADDESCVCRKDWN